mmetsp:Transcript_1932/g.4940  ORF Transcript_1932/g.4940 Transcript_1932/m.4940 type:complete len:94 (-) Transcript_1932:29-310(-)
MKQERERDRKRERESKQTNTHTHTYGRQGGQPLRAVHGRTYFLSSLHPFITPVDVSVVSPIQGQLASLGEKRGMKRRCGGGGLFFWMGRRKRR